MKIRWAFIQGSSFRDDRGSAARLTLLIAASLCCVFAAEGQSVSTQTGSGAPQNAPSDAAAGLLSNIQRAAAPNAPANGAPGMPSVGAPANYQLSANDQVAVEVFGEEDLRTSARVNNDGNVSLPLLGSVRIAGLTLSQATARLTEMYGRDYLVNPKVNVTLVGYAKRRFTVLGQVGHPGSFEMPEGSPGGIELLEAIAIAGGYTRIAAPERITVRRADKVFRVDAKRLAKREGQSFRVEPGDTITVGESIF